MSPRKQAYTSHPAVRCAGGGNRALLSRSKRKPDPDRPDIGRQSSICVAEYLVSILRGQPYAVPVGNQSASNSIFSHCWNKLFGAESHGQREIVGLPEPEIYIEEIKLLHLGTKPGGDLLNGLVRHRKSLPHSSCAADSTSDRDKLSCRVTVPILCASSIKRMVRLTPSCNALWPSRR